MIKKITRYQFSIIFSITLVIQATTFAMIPGEFYDFSANPELLDWQKAREKQPHILGENDCFEMTTPPTFDCLIITRKPETTPSWQMTSWFNIACCCARRSSPTPEDLESLTDKTTRDPVSDKDKLLQLITSQTPGKRAKKIICKGITNGDLETLVEFYQGIEVIDLRACVNLEPEPILRHTAGLVGKKAAGLEMEQLTTIILPQVLLKKTEINYQLKRLIAIGSSHYVTITIE